MLISEQKLEDKTKYRSFEIHEHWKKTKKLLRRNVPFEIKVDPDYISKVDLATEDKGV
jgi:hypothetical protein